MQAHMHMAFETALAPERVIAALTDFSVDRTTIWPTLDPDKYEVLELGETCAVAREGSRRPNVWALERYDWSQPGTVTWTLEASNMFAPGTTSCAIVTPNGSGGSHVELDGRRKAASPMGYVVVAGLALFGKKFVLGAYKQVFDRLAEGE